MDRWAVMVTQPRREAYAVENAERQGFVCFLPKMKFKAYKNGHKIMREEPMFSRYVFIFIRDSWYVLKNTYGVVGLIMDREAPAWVPEKIINDLKSRCNSKNVFVRERFDNGQRVIIQDGPFAQYGNFITAIYQGMNSHDRANVLISMLGQVVKTTLKERDLVAA